MFNLKKEIVRFYKEVNLESKLSGLEVSNALEFADALHDFVLDSCLYITVSRLTQIFQVALTFLYLLSN